MARVLVVGCGCRGRELARALIEAGHPVRGTSREESRLEAIEAAGAEATVADPGRLSTVMPSIAGVSALCWLMGTATGDREAIAAIHGSRLESLLEALVDTPVRGVVYEAAGTVHAAALERGASAVERAAETYRMPVALVRVNPSDRDAWLRATLGGVDRVLHG